MHSLTILLTDVQVSAVDPKPQAYLRHDSVSQSQTVQLPAKASIDVLTNMIGGLKSLFFLMQTHAGPESIVGGTAVPWESLFAEDLPLILVVWDFLKRICPLEN